MDAYKYTYFIPWMNNGTISGSNLQINGVNFPDAIKDQMNIWVWCVGDLVEPDKQVKHYRSDPFKLIIRSDDSRQIKNQSVKSTILRKF